MAQEMNWGADKVNESCATINRHLVNNEGLFPEYIP